MKFSQKIERFVLNNSWESGDIHDFIEKAIQGSISKSQISSFLMAIYCKGLSFKNLTELTKSYVNSGKIIPRDENITVMDKHSTGGVGDKMTFLICPIIAAAGGKIRKMSGRSLGHCSGTIDKLSDLDGFKHIYSIDSFLKEVDRFGFSIMPQSKSICLGDALTYEIRDECGITGSSDLIAASIIAKKIAVGASVLLLDIKLGEGGLFSSVNQARETAEKMIQICNDFDLKVKVFFSDMNTPLGKAIGGSSEMGEALNLLLNFSDKSQITNLAIEYSANLLYLSQYGTFLDCKKKIVSVLKNGEAYSIMYDWLKERGCNPELILENYINPKGIIIKAYKSGWISKIQPETLGFYSQLISNSKYNSGNIILKKTLGEKVQEGDIIAIVNDGSSKYLNLEKNVLNKIKDSFHITETPLKIENIKSL